MAFLKPVVEIAFGINPTAAPSPGDWVDVSQWCMDDMTFGYGRDAELDLAQAGTLTLSLDNRDRRFDPSHTGGPYYPNVKPRRRVRVTFSGTVLFTGFIDGWPQEYDDFSRTAVVRLRANDAMTVLGIVRITGTPYELQVFKDAPISWYPLDEEPGVSQARNIMDSNRPGIYAQDGVKLDSDTTGVWKKAPYFFSSGRPGGTLASPDPAASRGFGINLDDPLLGAGFGNPSSIECWVQILPQGFQGFGQRTYGIASHITSTIANSADLLYAFTSKATNLSVATQGNAAIDDGGWHHVVMTADGTNKRFYVDGVLDNTVNTAATLFGTSTGFIAHYWGNGNTGTFFYNVIDVQNFVGYLKHIAYYNYKLSDTQIKAHFDAAFGWPNDTTGQRVTRILDIIGWPTADRVVDTGVSRLQGDPSAFSGFALGYLQEIAKAEQGNLFCDPDGKIHFRNRQFQITDANASSVQVIWGDSGADVRFKSVQPSSDELYILNDAVATRKNGRRFVAQSASSISINWTRSIEIGDLLNNSDAEVEVLPGHLIKLYATAQPRIARLTVDARYDSIAQGHAINRRLGDRVTVRYKQMTVGLLQSYEQFIERITHHYNWSALTWTVDYVMSPVDPSNYFIIGTTLLDALVTLGL